MSIKSYRCERLEAEVCCTSSRWRSSSSFSKARFSQNPLTGATRWPPQCTSRACNSSCSNQHFLVAYFCESVPFTVPHLFIKFPFFFFLLREWDDSQVTCGYIQNGNWTAVMWDMAGLRLVDVVGSVLLFIRRRSLTLNDATLLALYCICHAPRKRRLISLSPSDANRTMLCIYKSGPETGTRSATFIYSTSKVKLLIIPLFSLYMYRQIFL